MKKPYREPGTSNASMVFWIIAIAVSVAALVIAAAGRLASPALAYLHLGLAAGSVFIFALFLMRDIQAAVDGGASAGTVAAAKLRAMGLIWVWGALCLIATYGTGVLVWKEWWHFTVPFVVLGTACLYGAMLLRRDDAAGRVDDGLLKLLNILAKVQLAGMLIAMVGLLVDGKMTRFLVLRHQDWAANNIFFFGAAALGFLSLYALSSRSQAQRDASRPSGRRPTIRS